MLERTQPHRFRNLLKPLDEPTRTLLTHYTGQLLGHFMDDIAASAKDKRIVNIHSTASLESSDLGLRISASRKAGRLDRAPYYYRDSNDTQGVSLGSQLLLVTFAERKTAESLKVTDLTWKVSHDTGLYREYILPDASPQQIVDGVRGHVHSSVMAEQSGAGRAGWTTYHKLDVPTVQNFFDRVFAPDVLESL